MKALVALALALTLAACGGAADEAAESLPTTVSSPDTIPGPRETGPTGAPSVAWADYERTVKGKIDSLYAIKDCAGLQSEAEKAKADNDATQKRTGHDNAALVAYIEAAREQANCM